MPPATVDGWNIQAPQPLVLELASRLVDNMSGRYSPIAAQAVVTVGWVGDVAVIAVLLKLKREPVALVLDPTEPVVGSAVERWTQEGKLLMRVGQADRLITEEVGVRVDGMVRSVVAHMQGRQNEDGFRQALTEYSGVERVLNRLAGTHHVKWSEAQPTAVPAGAR